MGIYFLGGSIFVLFLNKNDEVRPVVTGELGTLRVAKLFTLLLLLDELELAGIFALLYKVGFVFELVELVKLVVLSDFALAFAVADLEESSNFCESSLTIFLGSIIIESRGFRSFPDAVSTVAFLRCSAASSSTLPLPRFPVA